MSKVSTKGGRFPAIKATDAELKAKKVIEKYWIPKRGLAYSFADIMRRLIVLEANEISMKGKSILE